METDRRHALTGESVCPSESDKDQRATAKHTTISAFPDPHVDGRATRHAHGLPDLYVGSGVHLAKVQYHSLAPIAPGSVRLIHPSP